MFILILFLPLISFFLISLFSHYLGYRGVVIIAISSIATALFFSFYLLYDILVYKSIYTVSTNLILLNSGYLNLKWTFLFDEIVSIMLVVVNFISTMVQIYSFYYMRHDPHFSRFFGLLSLFTFFMLLLVTSFNYVQMFIGWEGVGLCSYLLVNFWFTRVEANKSAMKAMLVNRIGDSSFLIAIALIYYVFRSFDFAVIFSLIDFYKYSSLNFFGFEIYVVNLLSLLLFIAAVGKSAQLGLHTWLPDAMEGPTPVSALIHAATMVTAGVFLIIRSSFIFEYSTSMLMFMALIGALTAFFSGVVALVQNDIKRVIAFSTCSQLGYMVLACGLSRYDLALFHLFNHAFFKALLFLCAGSVIHAMNDEQDMRKYGGLLYYMPITYVSMVIASMALMGFPFLTGFYSKDFILELSYSYYGFEFVFFYIMILLAAFFTAFYSFRLVILTFWGQPKGFKIVYQKLHESETGMLVVFLILSVFSIFVGYFFKDTFVGFGSLFFSNAIFIKPYLGNNSLYDYEFISFLVKLYPFFFSAFGFILACLFFLGMGRLSFKDGFYSFIYNSLHNKKFAETVRFLSNKWFFDYIYNYFIVTKLLNFSYNVTFKLLDKNFFEIFGAYGLFYFNQKIYNFFNNVLNGYIYNYILILFFSFVIIVLFIFDFSIISFSFENLFLVLLLSFVLFFWSFFNLNLFENTFFKTKFKSFFKLNIKH